MNKDQAIEAARQIGVAPGDHITLQNEGQISNPHQHSRTDTGPAHVDAWYVENIGGQYHASKIHSDDR
ncbi:hypothetical protein GKC29_18505 [Micromonospora sp. WMMC415]|uniref:hypothetical protein n=1 Tax=Micromonospora sp. WMMC415 TaxID=2675222 RepID=UPI0012B4795D|nr:hypothetical protein [Micromonospora sp. WMMC415]QGN48622.1 hypothetical protein GKC29_18505 [Micromonospora sp. WMMC415]